MAKTEGLAGAAALLETELARFEELTEALRRERLNSEKAIKRAAQRLQQLADCDTRLAQHVQALVGEITAARERQQAQAGAVQECAAAIEQRAKVLAELNSQGESLQQQAAQVTSRAQQLFATSGEDDEIVDLQSGLSEIQAAVLDLAERAGTLVEAAQQGGFDDVARYAESLRLQLLATHNKVDLLQQRLN